MQNILFKNPQEKDVDFILQFASKMGLDAVIVDSEEINELIWQSKFSDTEKLDTLAKNALEQHKKGQTKKIKC